MWPLYVTVIALLSCLILASAVYALYWATRKGQFERLERGAKVIFDEEEPEGEHTDYFPGQDPRNQSRNRK